MINAKRCVILSKSAYSNILETVEHEIMFAARTGHRYVRVPCPDAQHEDIIRELEEVGFTIGTPQHNSLIVSW